jgi:hypothetical protein
MAAKACQRLPTGTHGQYAGGSTRRPGAKKKTGALATRHQVRIVNEKKAGKPAFFVSLAGNARFRASRWH